MGTEQDSLPDSAAIKYIINVEHLRDIPQMASTDKLIVIDHETRSVHTLVPIRPKPEWTVERVTR
jgi:hypothetical protein